MPEAGQLVNAEQGLGKLEDPLSSRAVLERFPIGYGRSDERSVVRHVRNVGLRLRLTRPTRLHIMVNCSSLNSNASSRVRPLHAGKG